MGSRARERKRKKERRQERKQYIFVIRELTNREIKRKYSRSSLGILWSVLNPLLSMAVLSMIFTQIFERSIENYPIYYLTGYILWQTFTGATNAAMTTLADNKGMLIKVKFPMQIFILARVYTALLNLGYSLVAYVVMLIVFQIAPVFSMLLFPIPVFFLVLFLTGVSYILATAYIFFGDVKHLYSVVLTLWMYCSAIFYPAEKLSGPIRSIIEWNPVYNFIYFARTIVLEGRMPEAGVFIKMMIWGSVVYVIGTYIFKKNKNQIMQRI